MKTLILTLALLAVTLCRVQSEDQRTAIPACIEGGFKAYQANGKEEAAKFWSKHSTPLSDIFGFPQFLETMSRLDAKYGRPLRIELIREVTISPSNKFIYIAWCMENGTLFWEFQCYKPHDEWLIVIGRFGNDKSYLPDGASSR